MSTGYTDCPCRDCFEISMDHKMCSDCEEAGCTGEGECLAPGAYEGPERINELQEGRGMIKASIYTEGRYGMLSTIKADATFASLDEGEDGCTDLRILGAQAWVFSGPVNEMAEKLRQLGLEVRIHYAQEHSCLGGKLSKRLSWWAHDGNNIPLCRVCDKCEDEKLAGYRPEVLGHYDERDVDEPIEEDC